MASALNHLCDEFDSFQDPKQGNEKQKQPPFDSSQQSVSQSKRQNHKSYDNKRDRDRHLKKSSNSPKAIGGKYSSEKNFPTTSTSSGQQHYKNKNSPSQPQEKKKRQSKWDKITPPQQPSIQPLQTNEDSGRNLYRSSKQDKGSLDSSSSPSINNPNYPNKSKPKESNFTDQPPLAAPRPRHNDELSQYSSDHQHLHQQQQQQQQQYQHRHHHHHNHHPQENMKKPNDRSFRDIGNNRPLRTSKVEPDLAKRIVSLDIGNKEANSSNLAKKAMNDKDNSNHNMPSNFSETAPQSKRNESIAVETSHSQSDYKNSKNNPMKQPPREHQLRKQEYKVTQLIDDKMNQKQQQQRRQQIASKIVSSSSTTSKPKRSNFDKPPSPSSMAKNTIPPKVENEFIIYLLGVPLTIGTNTIKNKIMQNLKIDPSEFTVTKIVENANKEGQVCNYTVVSLTSQELVDKIVMNPTFQMFKHPVLCLPKLQDIPLTQLIRQHQVTFCPQETRKAPYGKNSEEVDNLYKFFMKFGSIVDMNMEHWPHHCLVTYASAASPLFLLKKGKSEIYSIKLIGVVTYQSIRGYFFKFFANQAPIYEQNSVRNPIVEDEKGFIPSVLYKIHSKEDTVYRQ